MKELKKKNVVRDEIYELTPTTGRCKTRKN
jgi:hypothetical protein